MLTHVPAWWGWHSLSTGQCFQHLFFLGNGVQLFQLSARNLPCFLAVWGIWFYWLCFPRWFSQRLLWVVNNWLKMNGSGKIWTAKSSCQKLGYNKFSKISCKHKEGKRNMTSQLWYSCWPCAAHNFSLLCIHPGLRLQSLCKCWDKINIL